LHLVGILFPHINDDARSKPYQILITLHLDNFTLSTSHWSHTKRDVHFDNEHSFNWRNVVGLGDG